MSVPPADYPLLINQFIMSHDDYHKSLKEALTVVGFSAPEQEILIFLLELRNGLSASPIALELEIPRQTAYSLLKSMAKKGALSVEMTRQEGNNGSVFSTSKEQLSKFIDNRCAALQKAKVDIIAQMS
jgi:predicted DNA-binding transcriptional regulator